jgi:hypothetical protein
MAKMEVHIENSNARVGHGLQPLMQALELNRNEHGHNE